MSTLHLFAGPFPTVQGTQALIDQDCDLLATSGDETHLLTYAHAGFLFEPRYRIHRLADRPHFGSERSGPHLTKIALDLHLAAACRRLAQRLTPDIVQAHHLEALGAALLADPWGRFPLVFHAHALLGPELAAYLPATSGRLARRGARTLGQILDRYPPRRADAIVAVSRHVADVLSAQGCDPERIVISRPPALVPAALFASPLPLNRGQVRGVYVGNLDTYQGLDNLLAGLPRLPSATRARLVLEIITASDTTLLAKRLSASRLDDLVRLIPHGTPREALARIAAADFAIVPRHLPGGAPLKLVNALAIGRPVLVDPALGEDLGTDEALLVSMTDPDGVACAITQIVGDLHLRCRLAEGARRAATRLHSPAGCLSALRAAQEIALAHARLRARRR